MRDLSRRSKGGENSTFFGAAGMSATVLRHRVVDLASDAPALAGSKSAVDASADEIASFTPPTFTMKDLLSAIPEHCYERSALKSSAYVVMDFAMIGALAYAASHISTLLGANGAILDRQVGQIARWAAWATYCTCRNAH